MKNTHMVYKAPRNGVGSKVSRGRPAVLAAAVLVLFLFSGCERIKTFIDNLKPEAEAAPAEAVFAVNTTMAVQGQIQDYLALSGDIVSGSSVDTYSDVAGKVTRVYVAVGDRVNRGDSIAAVDPSRPGLNYVPGIAKAPISGIVTALPAQVGMTVSQTVPLARIAGGSALEIRLYVAERFISKMAVGLYCEITLDAWPGEVFRGNVTEVAPTVDPASRTMEIKVNVDNPGSKLKAGMFAKVRVITERKDGIVKIPSSAMISRFGETYVFVTEELPPAEEVPPEAAPPEKKGPIAFILGKLRPEEAEPEESSPPLPAQRYAARKRIVKPGILIDGVLEIQEGLAPDEEVIIRGQTLLEDGARVNIIDRTEPLAAE